MRAVIAAIVSFWAPGFADGLVGRMRGMVGWAAVAAAVIASCALSVWLLPLVFALRIAAVLAGYRVARHADRTGVPSNLIGALIAIGLTGATLVAARVFLLEAFRSPSSSMAPTLVNGDFVMTRKPGVRLGGVARGDVIVFRQPCSGSTLVKRAIALAGDTVEVVPAGHVFVLGDNRANSADSRHWGAVPLANVISLVFGVWLTSGRGGLSLARVGGID